MSDEVKTDKLCFVIGPIGEVGGPTRKHADMLLNAIIKPTIKPLGYQVKRADDDPTPGARARLLQRRLGFAFAAKHELVMSCR